MPRSSASGHADTFVRDRLPPPEHQSAYIFPRRRAHKWLNASELLDRAVAAGYGSRPALIWPGGRWTYRALLTAANQVAGLLTQDPTFRPGRRVLLHTFNSAFAIASWFGILRAGGVVVATMPQLRSAELIAVVQKAQVTHAIADSALADTVEAARASIGAPASVYYFGADGDLEQRASRYPADFAPVTTVAGDPALIAFSSGSTGRPKGCVHLHRDVLAIADTFSRHILRPSASDRFCGTPPLAFTFGLGSLVIFPAAAGGATVLPARPGFDALCDVVEEFRPTMMFTAPTGYRTLMRDHARRDLSSLRTCVSAGEPLAAATSDAWQAAHGLRLVDGIGATEMMHIFISSPAARVRAGATGKCVPGYAARIVDDDGRPLPKGAAGHLEVRGPTGCRYLDAPDQQARYVIGGWNRTGDIYRLDDEGYYWFVARSDDIIVSSGYNIVPAEIEDALLRHAAVAEVAVVGQPDAERGQICKAYVVAAGPVVSPERLRRDLQAFVRDLIAPYKYPREIELVDALPKTASGKLQRFQLRARPAREP